MKNNGNNISRLYNQGFAESVWATLSLLFLLPTLGAVAQQQGNQPKEDVTVNREYDEDGNLIRFDSTYTWSSGGEDVNAVMGEWQKELDLMMKQLDGMLGSDFLSGQLPDMAEGEDPFEDMLQMFGQSGDSGMFSGFPFGDVNQFYQFADSLGAMQGFTDPLKDGSFEQMHRDVQEMLRQQMELMEQQLKQNTPEAPENNEGDEGAPGKKTGSKSGDTQI